MTEKLLAVKKKYCKMFSVGFEPVLSAANSKLQPSEPSRLMNSARHELNKAFSNVQNQQLLHGLLYINAHE